jgi:TonB family protein
VRASGDRFALYQAEEYLPVMVEANDLRLSSTNYEILGDGGSLNNQFEFRADFSSAYALQDVFLVLDLKLEGGKRFIYVREIGDLKPNKSRWLKVDVPLVSPFGKGMYQLHLFAGGEEVLNSQQSVTERAAILDALITKRAGKNQDSPPLLFVGLPPVYPSAMSRAKLKGQARVRFRVLDSGIMANPVLIETSDAAFGESAISAIKQWRFIPKVKKWSCR